MDPAGGRNQTDMVTYTLADFDRFTWYLPGAWQAIGSVPNLSSLEHISPEEKLYDYQKLVQYLLDDIEDL